MGHRGQVVIHFHRKGRESRLDGLATRCLNGSHARRFNHDESKLRRTYAAISALDEGGNEGRRRRMEEDGAAARDWKRRWEGDSSGSIKMRRRNKEAQKKRLTRVVTQTAAATGEGELTELLRRVVKRERDREAEEEKGGKQGE